MLRAFVIVSLISLVYCTYEPVSKNCPVDERWVECMGCQNTCANPDIAARCRVMCKPGCVCKEGWFRNSKGKCVPPEKCDSCGVKEVFSACGKNECVNTCDEPDKSKNCVPERCIAGCICVGDLVRNKDNVCMRPEACTLACGPREFISDCGDSCRRTCWKKDGPIACNAACGPAACSCKPEYVRYKGDCILPSECPTCPPNEFYDCGSPCQTTCATLGEECKIQSKKCVEGCFCKEGFARNAMGTCIPVAECPAKQCPTDPNATVDPCGDPCPTTCENKDETVSRPCPAICIINGCRCKPGFVLGKDKKCIPISECQPKQCPTDPNAIVVPCGDPCPLTCENKDNTEPRACPMICIVDGCKCKDGFVLGKDKKCIATKDCPITEIKCKENEVNDPCVNQCPPETTCYSYFKGIKTQCSSATNIACIPECICKGGYIRNEKKECVIPPKCCTDPNSIMTAGPNPCNGGTCAKPEFEDCKKKRDPFGCQCKQGYVKKSETDKTCILLKSCPKVPCGKK